jgi:hypothetical protein
MNARPSRWPLTLAQLVITGRRLDLLHVSAMADPRLRRSCKLEKRHIDVTLLDEDHPVVHPEFRMH